MEACHPFGSFFMLINLLYWHEYIEILSSDQSFNFRGEIYLRELKELVSLVVQICGMQEKEERCIRMARYFLNLLINY